MRACEEQRLSQQQVAEPPHARRRIPTSRRGRHRIGAARFRLRHAFDTDRHQAVDVDTAAARVLVWVRNTGCAHSPNASVPLPRPCTGRSCSDACRPCGLAYCSQDRGYRRRRSLATKVLPPAERISPNKAAYLVRRLGVNHVVVDIISPSGSATDRLAILADVRDQHECRRDFCVTPWKEISVRGAACPARRNSR